MKQILLILMLISTFTLTGCIERTYDIVPEQTKQETLKQNTPHDTKTKNLQRATNKIAVIECETEESSSEDSTLNTMTGILVLIIGIMVFI